MTRLFAALMFAAVAVASLVAVTGCSGYVVRRGGDGSTVIVGGALFTDKGIAEADVEGLGKLRGYSNSPATDAIRAAVSAAVESSAKVKPTP